MMSERLLKYLPAKCRSSLRLAGRDLFLELREPGGSQLALKRVIGLREGVILLIPCPYLSGAPSYTGLLPRFAGVF